MTRLAWRTAIAAALLLAPYAAAGWFLAPRWVRDALVEQAAARGYELRLGEVRTDPFALSVEIADVSVRAGKPVAAATAISVDLAWASLWRDAWIVQSAEVRSPFLDLPAARQASAAAGASGGGSEGRPIQVQRLSLAEGTLRLPRGLTLGDLRASLRNLSTAAGADPAAYEASATPASGGTLRSQGALSLAPIAARGTLRAEALALAKVTQLAIEPIPGALGGSAAYVYENGRLAFHDLSLRAEPEAGGSATAGGTWDVAAGSAALRIDAQALPLALAQRFLPQFVDVRIASGSASSQGRLEIAEALRYSGSLAVADLRLEERDSRRLLIAWKQARAPAVRLSRDALELGEIEVEAPEGRLVIQEGGRINFAVAFTGDDGDAGGEGGFRTAFERLSIRGGTLHFADRTLENAFEVTATDLSGSVIGFSTAQGDPARVALNGRVQPYGSARIRGTIDFGAPTSLASFIARLRNLRLEAFNPYIAKFAGYRIASGRVSAELRYELESGRLVGDNDLVFEEMRLGEKVASRGALDVPLELAVALLADAEGRITLDIPVSGNLGDPKFDFGAIVARAVGNALRKIVTAPFRALARLVGGGGEDLGEIAFVPGRAVLSPPAEEDVLRVAKALAARPRLSIAVHAGYDPERDLEALRLRAARQLVAAEAGVDAATALDFSERKVLRAAERLYLRRGGKRKDLQALREAPQYGRALVRRLAATLPIGETAVDVLAQARAEAVRDALIAQGVDADRVHMASPKQASAEKGSVPTELALAAR